MWPNYNQFAPQPGMPMQMPMQVPQTIQQVQKSVQFYTVDSAQELDGVRPTLNVLYVGFNKKAKEIYVKQLTNDGLVSIETYGLSTNKKEKTELEMILEKINNIESRLMKGVSDVPNNATDGSNGNAAVNVG